MTENGWSPASTIGLFHNDPKSILAIGLFHIGGKLEIQPNSYGKWSLMVSYSLLNMAILFEAITIFFSFLICKI